MAPEAEPHLRVGEPERSAAGLKAVAWSLRHSIARMGVVRTARTFVRVNQSGGFDCPGCAWPEPGRRHIAEFCENGAKAVAEEAMRARAEPSLFARHSVEELAAQSDFWLGQQGRLTHPMWLAPGATHYAPISWDDALDRVAGALGSPDEAVFYTSGRTSNEAAFLLQLFVRAFGTNNLPDCSNMCHESSSYALTETIGIGKGTVTLDDFGKADLIVVVGQNPGSNHPRMLSALEGAKQRGARIITVNPLPEAGLLRFKNPQTVRGMIGGGTELTDRYLQVRTNGDLALFQALNRRLIELGAVDRAFVDAHCDGYDALAAALGALDDDAVRAATGLRDEEIDAAAAEIAGAGRIIVCWAMGLTQHKNSVATIREVVNLLLLRGSIGKPGAGVCPVRGHSNVQGDRTMGIVDRPSDALLDALEAEFGFAPPREHGYDTVDAIRAMRDGRTKVFFAMGGNFVLASPDTEATAAALRAQALTVQVSTKLNRSHLMTGREALILPTLSRPDRDVDAITVEDSMGVVHASRGRLEPPSDTLLSEVAIVCRLARRVLGANPRMPWRQWETDYAAVRDRIARVIPGFEDYNAKIAEKNGFVLPNGPRDSRTFRTATGKARLTVNALEVVCVPEGRLLLQSIRSHDQYNTTIYALNDRYRGIKAGRRVVLAHADDLHGLGLADGDVVDLVSEWRDGSERRAPRFRVVEYPIARGCVAAYYPEANALVPLDSVAETSNTPTSKSVVVRLEPAA
jgi:molybdopterin-dependent oxidoreductase alpha subunit